jgi:hypothetical protein
VPSGGSPDSRAQFDRDTESCRDRANREAYGNALPIAGLIFGGLYGAFHGAASGGGTGAAAEGTLVGIAFGGGMGFLLGLGAQVVKYNRSFDECMEARGYRSQQ